MEIKETIDNKNIKTGEKKQNKNLSPRIKRSLDDSKKNFERLIDRVNKLDLGNINDSIALENIIRVLDANDKVKEERTQKSRRSSAKNSIKINSSYSVVFANDPLSKNLINLAIRINQLNNVELVNIQENFLRNNIEDVMASLNSSKNLVTDTREVVSILMKTFNTKDKNKNYEKGSIFEQIHKISENSKNQDSEEQRTA